MPPSWVGFKEQKDHWRRFLFWFGTQNKKSALIAQKYCAIRADFSDNQIGRGATLLQKFTVDSEQFTANAKFILTSSE